MNIGRIVVLIGVLMMAMNSCSQEAPKGKLIYCSYSKNGHAGLGKDYCALIADEGKEPQIVVSLYNDCHYREAVKKTFPVTTAEVEKLQHGLEILRRRRAAGIHMAVVERHGSRCNLAGECLVELGIGEVTQSAGIDGTIK